VRGAREDRWRLGIEVVLRARAGRARATPPLQPLRRLGQGLRRFPGCLRPTSVRQRLTGGRCGSTGTRGGVRCNQRPARRSCGFGRARGEDTSGEGRVHAAVPMLAPIIVRGLTAKAEQRHRLGRKKLRCPPPWARLERQLRMRPPRAWLSPLPKEHCRGCRPSARRRGDRAGRIEPLEPQGSAEASRARVRKVPVLMRIKDRVDISGAGGTQCAHTQNRFRGWRPCGPMEPEAWH
jgi:hypothetical protein